MLFTEKILRCPRHHLMQQHRFSCLKGRQDFVLQPKFNTITGKLDFRNNVNPVHSTHLSNFEANRTSTIKTSAVPMLETSAVRYSM